MGAIELAWRIAVAAGLSQYVTGAGQVDHAIVAGVGDVDSAGVVGRDTARIMQLQLAGGGIAPARDEVAVWANLVDGVRSIVGDIRIALRVERNTDGFVQQRRVSTNDVPGRGLGSRCRWLQRWCEGRNRG